MGGEKNLKKTGEDDDRLLTFNEMRKNINEIDKNRMNNEDMKGSLKNKNDLNKILNKSFGGKEKVKVKITRIMLK